MYLGLAPARVDEGAGLRAVRRTSVVSLSDGVLVDRGREQVRE